MLGIAVATIVPSMAARNIATTSAVRTSDLWVMRGAALCVVAKLAGDSGWS
jgi:hypothetical protein